MRRMTIFGNLPSGRTFLAGFLIGILPLTSAPEMAIALPHGGVIIKGKATLSYSTNRLYVAQGTKNASYEWTSYNVKSGQFVYYALPTSESTALNFILSATPSSIQGIVKSNGILYFMNPNGLIFGSGSVVSGAGVMAFGVKTPWGTPTGSILNLGKILVQAGGSVILVGTSVVNSGTILVPGGTVVLASGTTVVPVFSTGSSSFSVATTGSGTVDDSGIISAETVGGRSGSILLKSGMDSGMTHLASTAVLDASAPNGGNGGSIETSGSRVDVADGAVVTTGARVGITGIWTLDPSSFYIGKNSGSANSTSGNVIGYEDISGSALGTDLGSNNVVIDSTQGAQGALGNIYVNDPVSWNSGNSLTLNAVKNIELNNAISNSGTGNIALHADDMAIGGGATDTAGSGVPSGVGVVAINTGGSVGTGGALSIFTNPTNFGVALTDPGTAGGNYSNSGSGTVTAYDLLSSSSDLYWIDQNQTTQVLSNNYALNTNIAFPTVTSGTLSGADLAQATFATEKNLNTTSYTQGSSTNSSWLRFGSSSANYSGDFDGQGYTLSNLTIYDGIHSSVGFFGIASSTSTIENVGTVGGSFVSNKAGSNDGGLAGVILGTADDTFSTGTVTGDYNGGGLAGESNAMIEYSYATGNVTGGAGGSAGGLVGYSPTGTIQFSYATGDVSNATHSGGLVGLNGHAILYSYSTGSASAGSYNGGFVGQDIGGTYTSDFWDTSTSGLSTAQQGGSLTGVTGLSTAQFGTSPNFTGWTTTHSSGFNSWSGGAFTYSASTDPWYMGSVTTGGSTISAPILLAVMPADTVTANNVVSSYTGTPYSGGNGVTQSLTFGGTALSISGLSYSGSSQGAVNDGTYALVPGGLSVPAPTSQDSVGSVSYVEGFLTISGGSSGGGTNSTLQSVPVYQTVFPPFGPIATLKNSPQEGGNLPDIFYSSAYGSSFEVQEVVLPTDNGIIDIREVKK